MKKSDIAKMVQEMNSSTKVAADNLVNAIFESMTNAMLKGDTVDIAGFGKFLVAKRAARMARNPKTGAPVSVPASKKPKFRPSKVLKDAVATTK